MKTRITIFLTIVSALLTGLSPATAAYVPWAGSTVELRVGVEYRQTFDCTETNVTESYFLNGVLPDGLTMSSTGVISGTPTTPGTYTLSNHVCVYNGGSNTAQVPGATLTFEVLPLTTPAPDLKLKNMANSTCEFYAAVIFPSTPDPQTVQFGFTQKYGTGSLLVIPTPDQTFEANKIYEFQAPIAMLNATENVFGYTGIFTGETPFTCGSEIKMTIAYQTGGAPTASKSSDWTLITTSPDVLPTPLVNIISLDSLDCSFYLTYVFPAQPDQGSVSITLENQAGTRLTAKDSTGALSSYRAYELYSGPTPMALLNSFPIMFPEQAELEGSSPFACGDTLAVTITYKNNGLSYGATTAPLTISGRETVTPPVRRIEATQRSDQKCTVDILYPIDAVEVGSKFTIRRPGQNTDEANIVFEGGSTLNGLLKARLSMHSVNETQTDMALTSSFSSGLECSGTFDIGYFSATGEKIDEVQLDLQPQTPNCSAGYVSDVANFSCIPVDKGYYTNSSNQTLATPCPDGKKTLTTGSTSVNDCYTPRTQTISNFKAPKAIKFKSNFTLPVITTGLASSTAKITGPCKGKLVNVTTKKKVTVQVSPTETKTIYVPVTSTVLKVTAGKYTGKCKITLSAPETGRYLPMKKTVYIKVNKTGK